MTFWLIHEIAPVYPPPINRTLGASRSGRTGASATSSSRAAVSLAEFQALEKKVDKLGETQAKLANAIEAIKGFVNVIYGLG